MLKDKHYSFSMVFDLVKRDHPECLKKMEIKRLQAFRNLLKKHGYKFDSVKYCKLQIKERIQFKYPSDFDLDKFIKLSLQKGQEKTVEQRKSSGKPYVGRYDVNWWMNKGYSEAEALVQINRSKREHSPFCKEFYTLRGQSDENALLSSSIYPSMGAHANLKNVHKPNTEVIVKNWLESQNINYSQQFRIKRYIYDFFLADYNLIIECNGRFWHADPYKYKPDQVFFRPGMPQLAFDIWHRDYLKEINAENCGYRIVSVWEDEINNGLFEQQIGQFLLCCRQY